MQVGGPGNESAITFIGVNFGDLSYGMYNAVMPGSMEDISLTTATGALVFAGHCDEYATADYNGVMADAANGFANVGTMQRASLWNYMSMIDTGAVDENDDPIMMPNVNETIARDHALCYAVGGGALMAGVGDEMWMMDTSGMSVNAETRLMNLLGVQIDNMVAMNLLLNGTGTDTPLGLLASNADGDDFGLAAFMGMAPADAMTTYMLSEAQYGAIMMWAGGWLTDASSIPLILLGGSGSLTASGFVNATFGDVNPIDGEYLDYSLNMGGLWAFMGNNPVSITPEQSGNILYGPLG